MNIRDALMQQSPSLALQRAAANEIARLDALIKKMQDSPLLGFIYTDPFGTHFSTDQNEILCGPNIESWTAVQRKWP